MQTIRNELKSRVLLCDGNGQLNPDAVGWSRRPVHVCNLRGRFPRKKKWDYWCITGKDFLLSATIAHIDYLAVGALYFLEYKTKRFAERIAVKMFPRVPKMPQTVDGTILFDQRHMRLRFEPVENGLEMALSTDSLDGKPFEASLLISRTPEQENLNVVIPWNAKTFQFTSKQQCLPTQGAMTWGEERLSFAPGSAFACLDYGRGVWPYRTTWNWAAFSGYSGDNVVGVNMGAKWTDNTGMNENGILLDGKMYKIFDDIVFEYDDKDFMKPWRMRSESSDKVRLAFTPFYEKAGHTNLLLISATTHQMFGYFSGELRVDDTTVPIRNLLGWAEEHRARW